MARTDALSITTNGSTADKLAESYGKVIDSIQKGAISEKIKNTDYSGDPTTGSVEVNRFNNAASNNYGTARTAGAGSKLINGGKVTINLNQDKEIVEEKTTGQTNEEKAINAVKKVWGAEEGVYFSCMGIDANGRYIVTVNDSATSAVFGWYSVDVETGEVKAQ